MWQEPMEKDSVCAFLTSVLTDAGYATGTFVSPHLEETRERFLLNGEKVSEKIFERAWRTVREVSQHMEERKSIILRPILSFYFICSWSSAGTTSQIL